MTGVTGSISVLVVDDDAGMRSTTVEILGQAGYHVSEAGDGNVALECLAAQRPDVLLMDVRMPERDGISVLETMDPEPPPPDVVLVSAYALDNDIRLRLGSKVHQYLRKPVPPRRLLEAVSSAAEQAVARSAG